MSGSDCPRIVLIEDNAADVDLFRMALSEAAMEAEVKVIRDGADALAWVSSITATTYLPHLAVIDLNLPKHDGVEIIEALRVNPHSSTHPVLVLSSSPSPNDMARVLAFPETKYLTKPTHLDQYLEIGFLVKRLICDPPAIGRPSGASC
jgi:DNA-binding response OmpR family regulator